MTLLRESPSGPEVTTGNSTVISVFGRTGDVVAEQGDYDTDQIQNESGSPGFDVSETLESFGDSDTIQNDSAVTGATLTDALQTLLASQGGGVGSISDSFIGGNATTLIATNSNASFGDLGWGYITWGTDTDNQVNKIVYAEGLGVMSIRSPSTADSGSAIYLGRPDQGLFDVTVWAEATFRGAFSSFGVSGTVGQLGFMDAVTQLIGTGESAGFTFQPAISPNYLTVTSHLGAGNTPKDTGVPCDDLLHNFRMVRLDDNTIEFFIDGISRTTHSTGDGDGIPTGMLTPFAGAIGQVIPTTTYIDNYLFARV